MLALPPMPQIIHRLCNSFSKRKKSTMNFCMICKR